MKKRGKISLILVALVLLGILLFVYAGSDQMVSDVAALQKQVAADWAKHTGASRDAKFSLFHYYGTDNGYHIVYFELAGFDFVSDMNTKDVEIAGYRFFVTPVRRLMAYKNGKFIELRTAYWFRLVGRKAIEKAGTVHAKHYPSLYETEPTYKPTAMSEPYYTRQYGPVDAYYEYNKDPKSGYLIICAVQEGAPSVSSVKVVAGREFYFQRESSLCAYNFGKFIDLEEAYNRGLVSEETIAIAAELHARRKNAID